MKSPQYLHNDNMERIKNLMNAGDLLEDGYVDTELVKDDDRDMVIGIAELLRMVEDEKNRKKMADKVIRDFERDNIRYSKEEFLRLINL